MYRTMEDADFIGPGPYSGPISDAVAELDQCLKEGNLHSAKHLLRNAVYFVDLYYNEGNRSAAEHVAKIVAALRRHIEEWERAYKEAHGCWPTWPRV